MKNLFGINKNSESNAEKFVIRKVSSDTAKYFDRVQEAQNEINNEKHIPIYMPMLGLPLIILGASLIIWVVLSREGFVKALESRGYLFYIGIAIAVIGVIFFILVQKKKRKIINPAKLDDYHKKYNHALEVAKKELNIPKEAIKVNIIVPFVKETKEGERLSQSTIYNKVLFNMDFFFDSYYLCMADIYQVIGIEKEGLVSIELVNKAILVPEWINEEPASSDIYRKKYYISSSGLGYRIPKYYNLKFKIDEEFYEIWIPQYEEDKLKKLFPDYLE